MVVAALFGNIMNFLYNAYLGRHLSLEDFGEISLFGSLLYLTSVPISALGRSITHSSAYLHGKYGSPVKALWVGLRPNIVKISFIAALLWIAVVPVLQKFFQISDWTPFILFAPVWVIATLNSFDSGFLNGSLIFPVLALSGILEAASKFGFSALFVSLGMYEYVYAALPLSIAVSLALVFVATKKLRQNQNIKVDEKIDFHDQTILFDFYFKQYCRCFLSHARLNSS